MSKKESDDVRFLLRRGWIWWRRDRKGLSRREYWRSPDGGIYAQTVAVQIEGKRGDVGIMLPLAKLEAKLDGEKKDAH